MQRRILVIDDDKDILEVVQLVLESADYLVTTSETSQGLQELYGAFPPDLLLLDVLLSGEDGIEVCQQLKKQDQTKNLPVVMFSAHANADKAAKESGADDFLAKPFDISALLKVVQKHLSLCSTESNFT